MTKLKRFAHRTARRAPAMIAPVMLALGLFGFALSQMPFASTLWYESLTAGSSLDIATSTPTATNTPVPPTATATNTPVTSCIPTVTLVSHAHNGGTNSTTYEYNVVRGGSPGSDCQEVSYFAINVCFNPTLGAGFVTAEAHPGDYFYDPSNSGNINNPKRIKWGHDNDNVPPNNLISPFNLTFTVTVAGNVAPVNTMWELHAGSNSTVSGSIQGPGPNDCGNLIGQSAPIASNGVSPNACLPLKLSGEPVRENDGQTTFRYTLTGGSASGKVSCPAIETVLLPVCFNPYLDPEGWLVDGSKARDWRYAGQMDDAKATPPRIRAATWQHVAERGPWNTSISFTAPGEDLPTVKVKALGRDASGAEHELGEVEVPRPAACETMPPTATPSATSTATPVATATSEPGSGDGEETATPEPTTDGEPTEAPEPAATSTPTPRPRNPLPGSQPTPTPPNGGAVWWD